MTEDERPFGLRLYEALKREDPTSLVRWRFNYAAIQRLKTADRKAVIKELKDVDYATIQLIKTEPPEEVARLLVARSRAAAEAAVALSFVFGLPLIFGGS